jgi:hypothetical protein
MNNFSSYSAEMDFFFQVNAQRPHFCPSDPRYVNWKALEQRMGTGSCSTLVLISLFIEYNSYIVF